MSLAHILEPYAEWLHRSTVFIDQSGPCSTILPVLFDKFSIQSLYTFQHVPQNIECNHAVFFVFGNIVEQRDRLVTLAVQSKASKILVLRILSKQTHLLLGVRQEEIEDVDEQLTIELQRRCRDIQDTPTESSSLRIKISNVCIMKELFALHPWIGLENNLIGRQVPVLVPAAISLIHFPSKLVRPLLVGDPDISEQLRSHEIEKTTILRDLDPMYISEKRSMNYKLLVRHVAMWLKRHRLDVYKRKQCFGVGKTSELLCHELFAALSNDDELRCTTTEHDPTDQAKQASIVFIDRTMDCVSPLSLFISSDRSKNNSNVFSKLTVYWNHVTNVARSTVSPIEAAKLPTIDSAPMCTPWMPVPRASEAAIHPQTIAVQPQRFCHVLNQTKNEKSAAKHKLFMLMLNHWPRGPQITTQDPLSTKLLHSWMTHPESSALKMTEQILERLSYKALQKTTGKTLVLNTSPPESFCSCQFCNANVAFDMIQYNAETSTTLNELLIQIFGSSNHQLQNICRHWFLLTQSSMYGRIKYGSCLSIVMSLIFSYADLPLFQYLPDMDQISSSTNMVDCFNEDLVQIVQNSNVSLQRDELQSVLPVVSDIMLLIAKNVLNGNWSEIKISHAVQIIIAFTSIHHRTLPMNLDDDDVEYLQLVLCLLILCSSSFENIISSECSDEIHSLQSHSEFHSEMNKILTAPKRFLWNDTVDEAVNEWTDTWDDDWSDDGKSEVDAVTDTADIVISIRQIIQQLIPRLNSTVVAPIVRRSLELAKARSDTIQPLQNLEEDSRGTFYESNLQKPIFDLNATSGLTYLSDDQEKLRFTPILAQLLDFMLQPNRPGIPGLVHASSALQVLSRATADAAVATVDAAASIFRKGVGALSGAFGGTWGDSMHGTASKLWGSTVKNMQQRFRSSDHHPADCDVLVIFVLGGICNQDLNSCHRVASQALNDPMRTNENGLPTHLPPVIFCSTHWIQDLVQDFVLDIL